MSKISQNGIKAKFSNLIQQAKKFFIGTPAQPLTEQEQKELAYAQYRASIEVSQRYTARTTAAVKNTPKAAKTTVTPSTRLTVPNRNVKGQVIDTVLYKLTGGQYGVIDILEDDATNLVTA